jgi:hypothetical protein
MGEGRRRGAVPFVITVMTTTMFGIVHARIADAKPGPCASVRNIVLPDDPTTLAMVQVRILECVRDLQLHRYGKKNKQQCVQFANDLMNILRPAHKDKVIGQSSPYTAGHFATALRARKLMFERDEKTGLPVRPGELRSRATFIWWDARDKGSGHVGVYVGGGLFVDEYVAYELAKLSDRDMAEITDPSRWAWSVAPRKQVRVPWPEGHWPRWRVHDGFSVVRVRGG